MVFHSLQHFSDFQHVKKAEMRYSFWSSVTHMFDIYSGQIHDDKGLRPDWKISSLDFNKS